MSLIRTLLLTLALTFGGAASAQTFPALTGRVVDQADIIPAADEAALTVDLAALEVRSGHQLVVATVKDLEGREVSDYGYRLGRAWAIGGKEADDGVLLLIAPNERRMHIAVGYGLEPVLTDALSGRIIRDTITPAFKAGDYPGGIKAGVAAITQQIELPPEEAAARAQAADVAASEEGDGGGFFILLFWLAIIFFFVILPMIRASKGKAYRGKRGSSGPVIIWGGGGSSGSSWGSGGGGWSSGGGGFSGGGGGFGGGGASGGW